MLLQKREENAITLAAKANNGRIVEEARAGKYMVSPNKRNTYMVAFILGLLFPIGCIWLKRSLRFKLDGRTDVQAITDAPIIGDIPQVKSKNSFGIVVRENHNGLMEETFRNLRTNLQYMLKEGLNKKYKVIWLVNDKTQFKDVHIKNVKFRFPIS